MAQSVKLAVHEKKTCVWVPSTQVKSWVLREAEMGGYWRLTDEPARPGSELQFQGETLPQKSQVANQAVTHNP